MEPSRVLVRVIPVVMLGCAGLWFYAAHDVDSRIDSLHGEIASQGLARGGRLPTPDDVRDRAVGLAADRGVSLEDVEVTIDENAPPPGGGGGVAGSVLSGMNVTVRYSGYDVTGRARARRWFVRRDQPLHVTFSLRREATQEGLPGTREPTQRDLSVDEPPRGR
ncbi:MAG: hypothetical protein WCJ30_08585 [Deltaproteobacteria bacterium]